MMCRGVFFSCCLQYQRRSVLRKGLLELKSQATADVRTWDRLYMMQDPIADLPVVVVLCVRSLVRSAETPVLLLSSTVNPPIHQVLEKINWSFCRCRPRIYSLKKRFFQQSSKVADCGCTKASIVSAINNIVPSSAFPCSLLYIPARESTSTHFFCQQLRVAPFFSLGMLHTTYVAYDKTYRPTSRYVRTRGRGGTAAVNSMPTLLLLCTVVLI